MFLKVQKLQKLTNRAEHFDIRNLKIAQRVPTQMLTQHSDTETLTQHLQKTTTKQKKFGWFSK